MEKIKKIIEKYKNKQISDKKKIENLIYFLVMLVILVIGMNTIFFKDDNKKTDDIVVIEKNNVFARVLFLFSLLFFRLLIFRPQPLLEGDQAL